jgi:hypothetical protein
MHWKYDHACFPESLDREFAVNLQLPGVTSRFKSGFSHRQWLGCLLFAPIAHLMALAHAW